MTQTIDAKGDLINANGMLGVPPGQFSNTIDASGNLVEQTPAYVPQHIAMPTYVPTYVEPPPPPTPAPTPKKGKIICARYHELGILSDELNILDQAYGAELMRTNPKWQKAYWRYARHIVPHLNRDHWKNRLLLAILTPLVRIWSREMGYRMGGDYQHSLTGSLLMWMMVRFWMTLGDIRNARLRFNRLFSRKIKQYV